MQVQYKLEGATGSLEQYIADKTEKHYVIWYTASKYHEREYMLLFTIYK